MFGAFRFVMGLLVVVTHIGGVETIGGIAVWGFYVLSGFLMTAVLNTRYGFDRDGLLGYAASRAFRLLPSYWLGIAITAAAIAVYGERADPRLINDQMDLPVTPHEIFSSVFILGNTFLGLGRIDTALSPPVWAVEVEILMYVCSCFFLSRSERTAKITAIVLTLFFPVLWAAAKFLLPGDEQSLASEVIYSFLPAALFPYAWGCWLWFSRDKLPPFLAQNACSFLAGAGMLFCAFVINEVSVTACYVLSVPCVLVLVHGLSKRRPQGLYRRADDLLGRMSYPIYLLHFFCAYLVVLINQNALPFTYRIGEFERFTLLGFFAVLAVILIVTVVFAVLVEAPVERVRHQVAKAIVSRKKTQGAQA